MAGRVISGLDETQPGAATMRLTGTLRRRGTDYYLEELLSRNPDDEINWTAPRIFRLWATAAIQEDVRRHIDRLATVTGSPGYIDTRQRVFVVLESVEPAALTSTTDPSSHVTLDQRNADDGTSSGRTS